MLVRRSVQLTIGCFLVLAVGFVARSFCGRTGWSREWSGSSDFDRNCGPYILLGCGRFCFASLPDCQCSAAMTEVMSIALLLIGLKYAMGQYLNGLNLRHALSRRHQVPGPYQGFIDLQAYQKSIDYTVVKTRFSQYQAAFDDGLLIVVLVTGFLPLLYTSLTQVLGEGIWGQSLVLIAILALLSLPSLPFDWWSTFRIEQRFGFNKSSISLWMTDKIKGALVGFVFLFAAIGSLVVLCRVGRRGLVDLGLWLIF